MKTIIIYASRYGTTRQYAEELARRTGAPAIPFRDARNLASYDQVVYLGGLYAEKVMGLHKTLKQLGADWSGRLLIATVGLADPADPEVRAHVRRSLEGELRAFPNARVFPLRGGIDYAKLTLGHRTLLDIFYRKLKSMPPEKRTAALQAIIDSHGQTVDYVDFETLAPIEEAMTEA